MEELDGVPVLAEEARALPVPPNGAVTPVAVQTMAVMGASMVAGAAAVALVRGRRGRRLDRRRRRAIGPVVASRSFLVDIHVLGEKR